MAQDGTIIERMRRLKCAVVIPTYNNVGTICHVIDDVSRYCADIFVIDDGSTDATPALLQTRKDLHVIRYEQNRGKGYALRLAIREASGCGFDYLLSIDADGQHFADDIPSFVEAAEQEPDTLFVGARSLTAENMPSKNSFANKFSNFWYFVETGSRLEDTQSGFRLYPLARLSRMHFFTARYEFEVEVIVRAHWRGIPVKNIPIKVYYPPAGERVSHFRPGVDFSRISVLNTCLVTYALLVYYPLRLLCWFRWKNVRAFFSAHVLHSAESNHIMAASVAWGVLWGILPVWGWQAVIAVTGAHLLKLNKVVAFAATNISIPPMIPLIVFAACKLGGWMLGMPMSLSWETLSATDIATGMVQYVSGSILLGILASGTTYLLFRGLFLIFKRRK